MIVILFCVHIGLCILLIVFSFTLRSFIDFVVLFVFLVPLFLLSLLCLDSAKQYTSVIGGTLTSKLKTNKCCAVDLNPAPLGGNSPMKDFMEQRQYKDDYTPENDIDVAWGLVRGKYYGRGSEQISVKMINFNKKKEPELEKRALGQCQNLDKYAQGVVDLHRNIVAQILCISKNLEVRDYQIEEMKKELINHAAEKVEREIEYQDWSKMLNGMLKQNEELKNKLEYQIIDKEPLRESKSNYSDGWYPISYSVDMIVILTETVTITFIIKVLQRH
jgi:hypothetical protein